MKNEIQAKFDSYPEQIKPLILCLRELVLSIAEDLDTGKVEESLKWGEPRVIPLKLLSAKFGVTSRHPTPLFS